MNQDKKKLTLYRPAIYQIRVPGVLDQNWSQWGEGMMLAVEYNPPGTSVTTLTGELDQAALIGLIRRLYSLGLPLISVICLETA